MTRLDLTVVVLQHNRACAVQQPDRAARRARELTLAERLDAEQRDLGAGEERRERADRVAAATDTGDHRVGPAAGLLSELLDDLLADHRL